MATIDMTGTIGWRSPGKSRHPLEKPLFPISDETISKLFTAKNVGFSEDGKKILSSDGKTLDKSRLTFLADSDELKFSIAMEDNSILFNARLFDMNHGKETSIHVVRMALLNLTAR